MLIFVLLVGCTLYKGGGDPAPNGIVPDAGQGFVNCGAMVDSQSCATEGATCWYTDGIDGGVLPLWTCTCSSGAWHCSDCPADYGDYSATCAVGATCVDFGAACNCSCDELGWECTSTADESSCPTHHLDLDAGV